MLSKKVYNMSAELRLTGQVHAETLEDSLVHRRKDHRRMYIAPTELFQLIHSDAGILVCRRADRKGDERFIGVDARVAVAEVIDLQILYRLYDLG